MRPTATNLFQMGRLRNQPPVEPAEEPIVIGMDEDESVQVVEKRLPARKFRSRPQQRDNSDVSEADEF